MIPVVIVTAAVITAGLLVNAALMRRTQRERERAVKAPEDAVAMLARWHAEGQAERDEFLTKGIEKILSEADGNG